MPVFGGGCFLVDLYIVIMYRGYGFCFCLRRYIAVFNTGFLSRVWSPG